MRLDLTINRMVHDAYRHGIITVEGGAQIRSHIHINDICDFYRLLLDASVELVAGQAFNVETETQSVLSSAQMVQNGISPRLASISRRARVDDRSYAIDGSKVAVLGYAPKKSIEDAVRDVAIKLGAGYWKDSLTNPVYQNMTHAA
jgi:nucleoside-diphosphate-sugar epimerase